MLASVLRSTIESSASAFGQSGTSMLPASLSASRAIAVVIELRTDIANLRFAFEGQSDVGFDADDVRK